MRSNSLYSLLGAQTTLPKFLILIMLFYVASPALAQVDRTGLNGTVMDASGQVLPDTQVTAVQTATGLRKEARSSSRGTYDIPELPVGVYTVTFTHIGFESLSFDNVIQAVQQTRTLNALSRCPEAGNESRSRQARSSW